MSSPAMGKGVCSLSLERTLSNPPSPPGEAGLTAGQHGTRQWLSAIVEFLFSQCCGSVVGSSKAGGGGFLLAMGCPLHPRTAPQMLNQTLHTGKWMGSGGRRVRTISVPVGAALIEKAALIYRQTTVINARTFLRVGVAFPFASSRTRQKWKLVTVCQAPPLPHFVWQILRPSAQTSQQLVSITLPTSIIPMENVASMHVL